MAFCDKPAGSDEQTLRQCAHLCLKKKVAFSYLFVSFINNSDEICILNFRLKSIHIFFFRE